MQDNQDLSLVVPQFSHLNIFSLCFIVENVGHVLREDLFSARTGVDAHHGHPNGPGGVSDGHLEICVICLDIFSLQHEFDDVGDRLFDISW